MIRIHGARRASVMVNTSDRKSGEPEWERKATVVRKPRGLAGAFASFLAWRRVIGLVRMRKVHLANNVPGRMRE